MKITKKILSMILAVVMVLGLLPATAFATGTQEDVIYLSISFDAKYIDDKNGEPIVYHPVPMTAIESVDLTEYGLDNMLYDFVLYVGTKKLVKRKEFEQFISQRLVI